MPSKVKRKASGQHAHHLVAPGAVFLLLLMPVFLDLGVVQQVIQAVNLGLLLFGRQRFAVFLDQPGNVPVFGLDDFLDRVPLGSTLCWR